MGCKRSVCFPWLITKWLVTKWLITKWLVTKLSPAKPLSYKILAAALCLGKPERGSRLLSLTLKPRTSVRAKISSVGTYVPPRLLTNADLEKMVATNNDWILERTGIRERHIVDKGVGTSDLAVEAARICLAKRGVDPH